MAILRKENAILRETDEGKIEELQLLGYEVVTEKDLKPASTKATKGE